MKLARLFSLIVALVLHSECFSQDSTYTDKWIPSGEVSVILRNNFSKPTINRDFGGDEFQLAGGLTHSLRLGYQFNLPYNFGITARAGFGFGSIVYFDDFYDSVVWPQKPRNYFSNVTYNLFTTLEIGGSYRRNFKNKYLLSTTAGFGFNFSNSAGWRSSIGNGFGRETVMNWEYNNNRKPFFFYELGISKSLPNHNFLTLSLAYEHSFSPVYSGNYTVRQSGVLTSFGSFYNSGTNVGVNLAYTFTRNKMNETAQYNAAKNNTSIRTEKNKLKSEKRFVHPKSIFFGASGGLFFTKNKIKDNDSPFQTAFYPWWSANGFAQIGIKNDFFYEVGVGFEEYASGTTIKNLEYSKGWSNMYIATKFSGGIGKRFIHKPSNFKLLNAQLGMAMILTYNTNKNSAGGSGGGSIRPNYELQYSAVNDYKLLVAPTFYLVLEKDFQVSRSTFLTLRYRYDQGIFPMFKQNIAYVENGVSGQTENLVYGTSQTFGFALKFKLLQKKFQ